VLCGRQIFAERFADDALAPRARRTARLDHIIHHLGLALGGRPAACFSQRLMLPVSKDTLLRMVRRRARVPSDRLNVIGIDDWARRRNHSYGTIVTAIGATTINPALLTAAERLQYEGYLRREEINAAVLALAKDGTPIKQIVVRLGHSRQLVRRIIRGERHDVFRTRQGSLEAHLPWLDAQWASGCRNGAELWRRLKGQGFRGSLRVVTEWATRRRRSEKADADSLQRIPSARTIAHLMTIGRHALSKAETITIAAIENGVPLLVEARALIAAFQAMVRNKVDAELRHGSRRPA
jgi:transposase